MKKGRGGFGNSSLGEFSSEGGQRNEAEARGGQGTMSIFFMKGEITWVLIGSTHTGEEN